MSAPEALGAYAVVEELGRGAMSVVYRARRGERDYAVKVMGEAAPEQALQFRRAAAALARLRHHALVEVVELGEERGLQYLVMSLAEGESLRRALARGPLGGERALAVAADLAGALVEVHRHGLLHRDIKPDNVVLEPDGRARLIDFGLVGERARGPERPGAEGGAAIVGTLRYAAPEQLGVLQRPVGPPADLYSLGVTLFEALTGEAPFEAREGSDFLHDLATRPAPDLEEVCPGVRPSLARIIARLLRKDPDDRYPTARDLLRDLRRADALDEALRAGGEPALSGRRGEGAVREEAPLVGRVRELTGLETDWARAREGGLVFARVRGEGGSGKSRLARELAEIALQDGARVVSAKCQQLDRAPFGPLREVAEGLAAAAGRLTGPAREAEVDALRAAAGERAALVGRLSAGLGALLGGRDEVFALEPGAEQRRFFQALADFLGRLGTPERPLLWLLDDVQWLDEGTQQVLALLAASPEAAHAMVLSTARPGGDAVAARFDRALDDAPEVAGPPLELAPLGREEVAALAASLLGDRALDERLVDKLAAATRGNPFAVGEVLRALLDSGALRPTPGGWTSLPGEVEAIGLPDDVVELVVRRLDALAGDEQRLLRLGAVIGGRFEPSLLAAAAGDPPGLAAGLERLVDQGLLERVPGGRLAFHHDRVREAVEAQESEGERADAHQAVAEALDALPDRSPPALYALARHFARGHPERDPARAAAANLAGGLAALSEHAYPQAYEMLERARSLTDEAALSTGLLAGLGRACAMTGRLDQAFAHLEAALPRAESREERFRLQYLITLTTASQGQNNRGLDSLWAAFEQLGAPYPAGAVRQALSLVWLWLSALFLGATGLRAGSATGEEARRRVEVSRLHYVGSMLALFDGDTFLTVQFIVRDFYNVHFLPPSAEKAIATTNYGSLLGSFLLGGPMRRYTGAGVAMAEQLGDRAAIAVCRAYEACGYKWAGDLDRGTRMQTEALALLARDVPGSWYSSIMITEQVYSYMHCGRARAAAEHARRYMSMQDRTNNQLFSYNTRAARYAALKILGEEREAAREWAILEPHYEAYSADLRLTRGQARFEVMIDRRQLDAARFADAWPELEAQLGEDYYSLYAWELLGYARLIQLEEAGPKEKGPARRALLSVILQTWPRFLAPVFRCHLHIWRAALARDLGLAGRAWRLLRAAEAASSGLYSPLAAFRIAEQRALLARDRGEEVARFYAGQALEVAARHGWVHRADQVRQRFELSASPAPTRGTGRAAGATLAPGIQLATADRSGRYADALLQVSLASASIVDVRTLARQALEATARVLGAERALFFLLDEATGELRLEAAAGSDTDSINTASISTTVVQRALETRAPVVLTGDPAGDAVDASASILAHNLRSVMAAPLLFKERVVGVVYLDNRLARGLFNDDDVGLLLGLANHIAIAVENARAARGEAERAAMARDMDLVGAVQSMLLPASEGFAGPGLRGLGDYRPATQCGGDWWWFEPGEGASVVWMGDVNGHGAGPAMITSTVSGAFHALRAMDPDADPEAVLEQLHRRVRALGGRFLMTLTAVVLDPAGGRLTLWNAGGPPIFLASGEEVRALSAPGQLLGSSDGPLQIGRLEAPLAAGDRLLMCTDGLLELDTPGSARQLGPRGVVRLLGGLAGRPLEEAQAALQQVARERLAGRPQPDDITSVLIEVT
jgi:serine phosphatase RsbU (regulator of sigma subunit)/tetratricopeptide (TPR) repeat protein/predicted Ser/Thr protein kinase